MSEVSPRGYAYVSHIRLGLVRLEFATASTLRQSIDTRGEPLVVMPFVDPVAAHRSGIQLAGRAQCEGVLFAVYDDMRQGFVATVNDVFVKSQAPFVAYVAQDAFAGRGWLAAAVAKAKLMSAGLVPFNDGKWHGELAAFGLVERSWAASNYAGALFHPGYRRHYGDTELTLLANSAGKLAYDPHAVLVEIDWAKDKARVDDNDRAHFQSRLASRFDGKVVETALLSRFS